jgi:lipoprotein-releasing system permease protein
LGVCLGVAVLIIVISVMSGFDRQLRDKILGFSPHLRITQPDQAMKDYRDVMRMIASNAEVKAVAPYVMAQVLAETQPDVGQSQVQAPWVRGIDPKAEAKMGNLPTNLVGKIDLTDRGVAVGTEFARLMNLSLGDRLLIYSPKELNKLRDNQSKQRQKAVLPDEYEVRGIFDAGYYEYYAGFILTSLEDAQELYLLGDGVHGLEVNLKDAYRAPAVEHQLVKLLGPKFKVTSWMEENSSILGALVVEKNVMFYLLFFIMIVAALCILSALITFVVQKTREIGMLKALGATDTQVAGLFLSQSGLVGTFGVVAGFLLGMLALAYRNEFLHLMNRMTGFELFPASIYGFSELPSIIIPRDIILICGSALVICVLGGVIPAWRAGRLQPVAALRYE